GPVLDNEFLYYYLQGSYMQQQIGFNEGTGATVSNIRIPILLSMRMELPALNLQRQMVQVLDAVDSKIELNQQINKNLLKLIDGIFNRVYLGSELVKNASRVKLSSIIRTKSGTFNPKKTSEVFVNHFSMPAFDAARFPVVNTASDIKSNKNVVEPFSILVSKMNPDVKRVWLPNTSKELLNVASTEFLTFNADVPEMQAFVYAVVNDKRYQKYLESNATGSTNSRQRVLPRVAYSYEIPYVKEVAQQFGFQIVDIMDMIKLNKEQNQHLIRLRNVLLPKLLAGDIDLSNIKTVMNNA
ncbi:restriction endonuclease subunit S, partial [Limosilactobacillus fermentum]